VHVKFSMVNFTTLAEITSAFQVQPSVLLGALSVDVLMGIEGGHLPAIRAAQVSPVVYAMREA
jgi:hypothetical protein